WTSTSCNQVYFHHSDQRRDGVPGGPGDSLRPGPSHFVDVYLVRQHSAARLSFKKEHEQLFWRCANCYRGLCRCSLPSILASSSEAKLCRLRKSSQERLLKLSLWRFPAAYRA